MGLSENISNLKKSLAEFQKENLQLKARLQFVESQIGEKQAFNIPEAILFQDEDLIYRWTYFSGNILPVGDLEGKSDHDIYTPEEAKQIVEQKKQILENGIPQRTVHSKKIGTTSHSFVHLYSPRVDPSGKINGIITIIQDISDKKIADNDLVRRLEGERLLAGIASDFLKMDSSEIEARMRHALAKMAKYLEADFGAIRFIDPTNEKILPGYEWKNPDLPNIDLQMPGSRLDQFDLMKQQLINNKSIYVPEVLEIPEEGKLERVTLKKARLESLVLLPIFLNGRFSGYIGFGARKNHPFWSEREKDLLELFKSIIVNILESQGRKKELQESQNLYQKVVELSPNYIFVTQDDKVIYSNPASANVLGYKNLGDIIGKDVREIFYPRIYQEYQKFIEKTGKASNQEIDEKTEFSFLDESGQKVYLEYSAMPVEINGKPASIAVATDISRRKQIEKEIIENRKFLKEILDLSPMGIFVFDQINNTFSFFNNAIQNLAPEMINSYGQKELFEHFHPEDRPKLLNNRTKLDSLNIGEIVADEYRWITTDGNIAWIHSYITPIEKSPEGKTIKTLTIVHDITDLKKTQDMLRKSEERHRGLIASIPGIVYQTTFNKPFQLLYISDFYQKLTGYPQIDNFPTDLKTWIDLIHPDDLDKYQKEFEKIRSTDEVFELEYRIRHANGNYIWVKESGRISVDEENHPSSVIGLVMDISTQKRDYEAMRLLSQDNLRLLAQARRDSETKTLLLNEVNHRVKNNIMGIIGLLDLEKQQKINSLEDFRFSIDSLISRINSLAVVHDILSSNQWTPVQLDLFVQKIIENASAPAPKNLALAIDTNCQDPNLWISTRQATGLALILNELTTNSIQHAFKNRKKGAITVDIRRDPTNLNQVCIRYADNGPGWPEEVLDGSGGYIGIEVIKLGASSPLNGNISFENKEGAIATLIFKPTPQKGSLRVREII